MLIDATFPVSNLNLYESIYMNRYEILMLATPAITQDEASNIEKGIQELLKEAKGSMISFERWGKFRLAYPVKKNDYGIYFLTRFEVPTTQVVLESIKTAFTVKYNEVVMRHVVVKLDAKQSLEYKRPQSVEDVPVARDVDSFLRENNMEGLRGSVARDNDKRSESLGADLDESFNDEELN